MDKIKDILAQLESQNDVKIIFASEAGSRAWGLESEDSDYDIRFVFVHKRKQKYVSLDGFAKTIDGFSDDRVYDWQGWDITKALKHLKEMNPGITEWLYSPIVYLNDTTDFDFVAAARKCLSDQCRVTPLMYHYRSMAKSNFKQHIENKPRVNLKKYLYVIRPAGMFVWLSENNDTGKPLLNIDFNHVLDEIRPKLTNECYESILSVIKIKKGKSESDEGDRIKHIDDWIQQILNHPLEKSNDSSIDNEPYNKLLFSILKIKFDD